jgi:hypothetical protein
MVERNGFEPSVPFDLGRSGGIGPVSPAPAENPTRFDLSVNVASERSLKEKPCTKAK